MKQLFTNWKILLFFIFLLAFALRVIHVDKNPTFISDEASIGYNAYSILKTGNDEWGKFLPLSFKSFGEYKLPLYIYLTVPSIFVFGLSEFAVRLPSAVFGSLTVLLIFFFVCELLRIKISPARHSLRLQALVGGRINANTAGIIAALLLAVNPWHIQVSRMALEANLSLFLTLLAVLFLMRAKGDSKFYYLSFLLFVLTLYTYNSSRVFTPLFILSYFLIKRREIKLKRIVFPLAAFFLLSLPIIISGFLGSRERLYKVSIFTDPGIVAQINQARGECQGKFPKSICLSIYNKPVIYSQTFIKNYLSHFSWRFLFQNGAGLAQYGVPGQGMLYFWELPLIFLGAVYLIKHNQLTIFALWILIAPLANSFTGSAHPVRAILLLPVWPIFSALGVYSLIGFLDQRPLFKFVYLPALLLVLLVSLGGFVIRYFFYYPKVTDWNWQMGYRELYQKLKVGESYNRIFVSKFYGEPHIFYLFYNEYDPKNYQEGHEVTRYDRQDLWTNVDKIGKYEFVQEPQKVTLSASELLVVPLQQYPFAGKIIDVVRYNNGSIAFLVLKNE